MTTRRKSSDVQVGCGCVTLVFVILLLLGMFFAVLGLARLVLGW